MNANMIFNTLLNIIEKEKLMTVELKEVFEKELPMIIINNSLQFIHNHMTTEKIEMNIKTHSIDVKQLIQHIMVELIETIDSRNLLNNELENVFLNEVPALRSDLLKI
jgi:hypothetical protein